MADRIDDTIVAISSALSPAARIIVRMTGPDALPIASRLTRIDARPGAYFQSISSFESDLPAWVYVFRGPRSATGQDTVEIHLPGNVILARTVMNSLIQRGARPAGPGEFTARAYFNGRVDLAQAEGVAAAIAASNQSQLDAARRLLDGELAQRVRPIMDRLADTLALVEVGIDFSDEDVTFLPPAELNQRVVEIDAALELLLADSRRFGQIAHEPQVVLVGRPNAGKSTLLNALCGHQRAVVSPVAGTTRDLIWSPVPLRRGMIRLIDAAGLDVEPPDDASAESQIAREMQRRAVQAAQSADVVALVVESGDPRPPLALSVTPRVVIYSKLDLVRTDEPRSVRPAGEIAVSAVSGEGLEQLRDMLDAICFGTDAAGARLALNDRHVAAGQDARASLGRVLADPHASAEVVSVDLREALDALGGILGQVSPDDLLGRIFGAFCIGK